MAINIKERKGRVEDPCKEFETLLARCESHESLRQSMVCLPGGILNETAYVVWAKILHSSRVHD